MKFTAVCDRCGVEQKARSEIVLIRGEPPGVHTYRHKPPEGWTEPSHNQLCLHCSDQFEAWIKGEQRARAALGRET